MSGDYYCLFHFYFFYFADMLPVSGRSVLIVGDTNKDYFPAKSLERIGIVSVFYLLNSCFSSLIPFQFYNEYGIA